MEERDSQIGELLGRIEGMREEARVVGEVVGVMEREK